MTTRIALSARGVLSDRRIQSHIKSGSMTPIADGGGLYFRPPASFAFRYTNAAGRRTWLGLGGYVDVSLKEARETADRYRRMLRDGLDPAQEKAKQRSLLRRSLTAWKEDYLSPSGEPPKDWPSIEMIDP